MCLPREPEEEVQPPPPIFLNAQTPCSGLYPLSLEGTCNSFPSQVTVNREQ